MSAPDTYPAPWPAAILAAPTAASGGLPVTLSLVGPPNVQAEVVIWRRRTVVSPWPLPTPGAAQRASFGIAFAARQVVVAQPLETVTLTQTPLGFYATFAENLTGSIGASLPWIWAVPILPLPAGASVIVSGSAKLSAGALTWLSDGRPSWV